MSLILKSRRKTARQRIDLLEKLETRRLLAAPIVITKGGTYSGTWESFDRKVPAVTVRTTEPVVIENSIVRGTGNLIASGINGTDVTVRNTEGYGLNPNVYGRATGRFFNAEGFRNAVLENNYLENTTGIYFLNYAGNRTPEQTITIVGNKAKNIDGRRSDGNGGYLDFNKRTRLSDGVTETGYDLVQFVQFDKVYDVPGIRIAWNEIINEPGRSRVEDNVNVYKSSGTPQSPMLIHDNYVQGAYTIKPWQNDYTDSTYRYDWGFSGGGILLGDGVGSTPALSPSHVKAFNNTIVSTTNYGIAIAAGNNMEFYDNRIVSAGVLPDGRAIAKQNVGLYVWDSYKAGSSHFYSNTAHHNLSGWVQGSGRNDWWSPVSGALYSNTRWSGPITLATEAAEHVRWKQAYDARFGTPNLDTVVHNGTTTLSTFNRGRVTVNGGTLCLAPRAENAPATTPVITGLTVASGATLDLTNNALVIDYAAGEPSPVADVVQLVRAGRNGGAWNGTGIVSSYADRFERYTLGVAEARDVLGLGPGETGVWSGQTVDATAVLVKFTYGGDVNLDGRIDIDDYGQLDYYVGLSARPAGYFFGDLNFDGMLNVDDFGVIDFNVGTQGPRL